MTRRYRQWWVDIGLYIRAFGVCAVLVLGLLIGPATAQDGPLVRCGVCDDVEIWIKDSAIAAMERDVDRLNDWRNGGGDDWGDDDYWDDDYGDDDDAADEDGISISCCGCGGSDSGEHNASGGGGGGCGGSDSKEKSWTGDDDESGEDIFADDDADDDYDDDADDDAGDDDGGDDDDDQSHSDTNTQEEGVDEADLVKTDGDYLYLVSGGYLLIYDATPASALVETARMDMIGRPEDMYVMGDRAVIFTVHSPESLPEYVWPDIPVDELFPTITKISILSIEDRHHPKLMREIFVEGPVLGSRRVDGVAHVVFASDKNNLDLPLTLDPWNYGSEEEFWDALESLKAANREEIMAADITNWLPRRFTVTYEDAATASDSGMLTECSDHYHPARDMGDGLLSVLSIDLLTADDHTESISVISEAMTVYASTENLFVAGTIDGARRLWSEIPDQFPAFSDIHQFDIVSTPGHAEYVASGQVRGFVLNQFSMSEYDGFLRIATTYGDELQDARNAVYVLERMDDALVIVGAEENIALAEELYAARFIKDRGYLVTFPVPEPEPEEPPADPLFIVDLSEPTDPVVRGELEIPGFSTYIHPLGATRLLTIGEGGDWWAGANGGVAVSMFDVSDMDNPIRTHNVDLGDWLVTSDAKFDHHAFLYYEPMHMLAIPLQVNVGALDFSGVVAASVDPIDGFTYLDSVNHAPLDGEDGSDPYSGRSHPRRSVVIDRFLISISDLGLVVTDTDFWIDVLTIELPWKDRLWEGF